MNLLPHTLLILMVGGGLGGMVSVVAADAINAEHSTRAARRTRRRVALARLVKIPIANIFTALALSITG
jgi:hypothetical protein